jgi:peroxiredoxin
LQIKRLLPQLPSQSEEKVFAEAVSLGNNPLMLVFLRYQGCLVVCPMEMAELKREIGLFTQKKIKVFVFLQSSTETFASATNEADWPFFIVCDPQGDVFQMYAV